MPIEIKELHIRVAVNAASVKQTPMAQSTPGVVGDGVDKDALVAECVEQVFKIMQTKKER